MQNNLSKYLKSSTGKIRRCQEEAIKTFFKFKKKKVTDKAFLINLPTGAGKTGVISLISHLSKEQNILIICHRRAVKDQLYKEVSNKFFRVTLNDPNIKLKSVFKSINNLSEEGIYISTFQKLSMLTPEDLSKTQRFFDLIIIDEGHSEPSPVWREIVRQSDAIKVVITATPYRNDLFELNVDLDDYFIFTFKQAISDNIITEPNFIQVNSMDGMLRELQHFLEKNEKNKMHNKMQGCK